MMKIAQSNSNWIAQSNFGGRPNLVPTYFSELKRKIMIQWRWFTETLST